MDLFKWTKNLKPIFPNIAEKFLGKKIDEQVLVTEEVATIPSVNITDKRKVFEVSVAIPGLERKDIKLEIHDNCLDISSEKQYENEENNGQWMRREFGYATFQRRFQLPGNADPDHVNASLKNGVLNVKIGKKKELESTKKAIEIN
jgi:HSP20 family protein